MFFGLIQHRNLLAFFQISHNIRFVTNEALNYCFLDFNINTIFKLNLFSLQVEFPILPEFRKPSGKKQLLFFNSPVSRIQTNFPGLLIVNAIRLKKNPRNFGCIPRAGILKRKIVFFLLTPEIFGGLGTLTSGSSKKNI